MTIVSILLILLLEQWRPQPVQQVVRQPFIRACEWAERHLNDGEQLQGGIAWGMLAGVPALILALVSLALSWSAPVWSFLMGLVVLYLTIGFRHFSHQFSEIEQALQMGDVDRARSLLAVWRGASGDRLSGTDVARLSIERGLIEAHRHVFAPIFWFSVLGPAGALLYRLAEMLDSQWSARLDPDFGRFGLFSKQAFAIIDWIPARLTAAAFAVVGDFEDAVQCWRSQADRWPVRGSGIVLASGAGALGVRLGIPFSDPAYAADDLSEKIELGLGDEPDTNFMQRATALVWRTLLLALALLLLIWVSSWADFNFSTGV